MQQKDYYEILQVSPNAEPEVIKAAYRRLARKYHPDIDKSPEAAERMKEINAAYDILSDPAKRAAYDRLRERISAPPRYRREAPPERERARVPTIRCQNCGRIDNTLRLSGFLYIYSIVIMSFKRGAGGLLCSNCRRTEAIKYSLVTLLFGWWGIPWGIFWSLEALGTNLFGGKMPAKENAQLLRLLALQLMAGSQILNAVQALKDSLSFERDPKTEEFLQYLEASPEFKAAKQQSERRADVAPRPPSFLRRNWPAMIGAFIGIFLCVAIIWPPPPPTPPSLSLYLADFMELLGTMVEDADAIREWYDFQYETTNQFLDLSEDKWWQINDEFAWRYIVLYDELLGGLSGLSVPTEARSFHEEFTDCIEQSRTLLVDARSAIAERSESKLGEAMANGLRLEGTCLTRASDEWDRLSELVAP